MSAKDPIQLDDNGNPIYEALDDNGNPILHQDKKFVGPGSTVMNAVGDVWNWATGHSVFGLKDPGSFTAETKDPNWLGKKLAYEATTPLAIGGELAGLAGGLKGAKVIKGRGVKVPEVLEPEVRPIRGLLPEARREPFIAGPGGIQRESLTLGNAQEQARLLGYEPLNPGKPVTISGTGFDPQELKETNRLANLHYTDVEQAGGKRLDIPGKEVIPATSGDRRLGYNPGASNADLPYPLNITPESLRPRSQQTVDVAITPRRFNEPVGGKKGIEFGNEVVKPVEKSTPLRDLKGGTAAIEPGETILPTAPRATVKEVETAAKNTGVNPDALNAAELNSPPPVAKAVNEVIKEESSRPSTWKSVYHQINELSPELYKKSFRAVHGERQLKAQWMPAVEGALRKLTKDERANFGAFVEGSQPITSPNVQAAVQAWKQVEDDIGNTAQSTGLRMFTDTGEVIPFQKNPNYWPHIPIEELTKNKKAFIDKLVASGMSRTEAARVEAHYRKTGEIKTSAQYARDVNRSFPYKLDADIALNHIRNMAKRIAQNTEFGPRDIKGKGAEGISDLIEGTRNPEKARILMERIIGRDEREDAQLLRVLNFARKYSTVTKLQNFTLPNVVLGQASNALKASRHPIEAFKEVTKLLSSRYRDEMRLSGVWQDFATSLSEEIKPGRDWFGIRAGEEFNRGIGGAIGKAVAKASFKTLKANPADKIARKEIFELIGEDWDAIKNQPELSVEQLRYAAGRMAEKTQGLNVPGNLAHWMSKPVKDLPSMAAQMALIFKKMGYQQTRTVWDAIKTNPTVAIPTWLAAAQVSGELTGDVKAGIRGMWTGDAGKRVEDRGSYWLDQAGITKSALTHMAKASGVDEETIARLFDNYMQSFFLGLPADMIMSSVGGPDKLTSTVAGPVASDISKTINRAAKGDYKGFGKDVIGALPIPGSRGLAERLMEK